MIFVGARQAGKTYNMVMEVLDRYKDGDKIAIVGYSLDHAKSVEFVLIRAYMNKYCMSYNDAKEFRKNIKIVRLGETKDFDHVIVDELDKVLGEKFVCSTGGVIHLTREDIEPKNTPLDTSVFDTRLNVIEKETQDEKDKIEKFADELLDGILLKLKEQGIELFKNNKENVLEERATIDKILKTLSEIGVSIALKDDVPDSEIPSALLKIKKFVLEVMQCFKNEIEKCTKEIELTPKDDVHHLLEMHIQRSTYEHKYEILSKLNIQ